MIISLSIRNFVLIDRLDMQPGAGFTALTGETGAGKSIILDALALTLGGPADRAMIRHGCDMASIAAEFAPTSDHPVWSMLVDQGIDASPGDALSLRRVLRATGPARAFVNAQAVSAALLRDVGEMLVEIHGQHAASALLRPSTHRKLLDQYAGNETLLGTCAEAWGHYTVARTARETIEADANAADEEVAFLTHSVEELRALAPGADEAEALVARRTRLMQSERITEALAEAETALEDAGIEDALARAARATDRICRLPGFEGSDEALPIASRTAAEATERALIEVREAIDSILNVQRLTEHDGSALDAAEARLFALKAAARKHHVDVTHLPDILIQFEQRLELMEAGEEALEAARKAEINALAIWHQAADSLSQARHAAAARLEKAISKELKPLKMERASVRVAFVELEADGWSAQGKERIELDVETNKGAGYAPLRKIASGGELARFSLAMKCALAASGSAQTLIFDEADQGVGGSVAAAIGERLVRLSARRQVFAVTHSPQVAASAAMQWLIEKGKGKSGSGGTRVSGLDDTARQEEIARMLSGATVTSEARAAAGRLLEDA